MKHFAIAVAVLMLHACTMIHTNVGSALFMQVRDTNLVTGNDAYKVGEACATNVMGLPVSAVKLDRMLAWQIDNNPEGGPMLAKGLIQLAKSLNLKVIAEGVETQNQVDVLKEYGCDYQQGFYYAPTLNANELIEALMRKRDE